MMAKNTWGGGGGGGKGKGRVQGGEEEGREGRRKGERGERGGGRREEGKERGREGTRSGVARHSFGQQLTVTTSPAERSQAMICVEPNLQYMTQ